jgi:hypothetical protein
LKKLKIGLTGGEAVTKLERDQSKLEFFKSCRYLDSKHTC